ncbi:MAG: AAA family ATPase [Sulfuritalea sp.]|nr:AAA family ATPase [Sulfuritalea sp.]
MLNRIEIGHFKSILNQSIDFGRVNIFIGRNGAGKSNILEAIGMLSASFTGDIQYEKLTSRGVRLSSPDVFKSALTSQGKRKPIFTLAGEFDSLKYSASIRAHSDDSSASPFEFQSERLTSNGKHVIGRSPNSRKKSDLPPPEISVISYLEVLGKLTDAQRQSISLIRDFAIFAPSTPILRGVSPDESRKAPLGLYGGGLERGFESLLKTTDKATAAEFFRLFDWIKSIGVRTPSKRVQSSHIHTPNKVVTFVDKFMSPAFNKLYAYDVSEGALYVFFVLLLLTLKDTPRIFALDNVDSTLNPGMVRNLVGKIVEHTKKNDRQIFMTTHNPTALDAIDIFDPDQRIFIVKRNSRSGATLVDRVLPPPGITKELWSEAHSGMRLSNLWLDGMFEGALPPSGF